MKHFFARKPTLRKTAILNIKSLRRSNYSPQQLRAFSKDLAGKGHKELALAARFVAREKARKKK